MKKINYKGRCEKRKVSKCEEICRTYSKIQSAMVDMLENNDDVVSFKCNVRLKGVADDLYSTDFVIRKVDGSTAVRECVWPAFPKEFGFEPCYVNSRLASRGIPVACEVDIYGALSEYIGACVSGDAVTILDINNSVPARMWEDQIKGHFSYSLTDTFMGFHCGNTPSCKMCADRAVKYQLIQHRLLEPEGSDPDFTRGTLEGDIAPGEITFYRLQCDSDGVLRSYIAEGEVLSVATASFGGIGVFAIPEMGRFYRHVLIQKRYPHHGAVAFGHHGKALFEVFRYLGVEDIAYNQPRSLPYPTENPFG